MSSIAKTCHPISQSSHPLYRPAQLLVVADIFYLSVTIITRIPPGHAIAFMAIAVAIDRLVMPKFVELLLIHCPKACVPCLTQVAHLSLSFLTAKIICSIFGMALGIKQMCIIGALYKISIFATLIIYKKIKQDQLSL